MQKATAKLNSIIAAHQLQSSRIADFSTQLAVVNCVALHMRVCGVYGVWCVCVRVYVCAYVCVHIVRVCACTSVRQCCIQCL